MQYALLNVKFVFLIEFPFNRNSKSQLCILFSVKNRIKYRNKCVLYVQRIVRGFLARKQHQPRYRGIMKIKAVKANMTKSAEIASQLKGNKDNILRHADEVEQLINNSVRKIRTEDKINPKIIDKLYADIIAKIDNHNNLLKNELQVRNKKNIGSLKLVCELELLF